LNLEVFNFQLLLYFVYLRHMSENKKRKAKLSILYYIYCYLTRAYQLRINDNSFSIATARTKLACALEERTRPWITT